jgi:hypothetical protein
MSRFWAKPVCLATLLGFAFAGSANAQNFFDFEDPPYPGDVDGEVVTGVDGWYNPVAGSAEGLVFEYTGNTYAVTPNPNPIAGSQMLVTRKTSLNCARAQRDVPWGDGVSGTHRFCVDFNFSFVVDADSDPLGPAINFGSVSVQPYAAPSPTSGIIILFFTDDVIAIPMTVDVGVIGFLADGTQSGFVTYFPLSPFADIPQNEWRRLCVDINLDTNMICRMGIEDLTGATPSGVFYSDPVDPLSEFFLGGGSSGAGAAPGAAGPITGIRLFGGGSTCTVATASGNAMSYDNLGVACAGDIDADGDCDLGDLALLLSDFGDVDTGSPADLNCNADVTIDDLALLLSEFGTVCGS